MKLTSPISPPPPEDIRNGKRVNKLTPIIQAGSDQALVTVVLPAYNEAIALPKVLSEIFATLGNNYEVLVVDDGSTDDTALVAAEYPCSLVRHTFNQGKGVAVRTGLQHARGKFVVIMDADASYPASAIPLMVNELSGCDVVRCIRQKSKEQMPVTNIFGNIIFDLILTKMAGLDGSDHLSGLYGLRRDVLQGMNLEANGFDIEAEIGIKARSQGLKISTIPIQYLPRLGEKKLKAWKDGWKILSRILLMMLVYNPVLTFIFPGLFIMLLALVGVLILRDNVIQIRYFGLDIHSFILATLGVLAGFQLVVFGLSAALYGVEVGAQPHPWLVLLSSVYIRMGSALIGLIMVVYGLFDVLELAIGWIVKGPGSFTETRPLVLATTIMVGGLQLLSAALFISIFSGRLRSKLNISIKE